MNCTECHSENLRRSGWVFRYRNGIRTKVQQYQCKDCGKVFTPKDSDDFLSGQSKRELSIDVTKQNNSQDEVIRIDNERFVQHPYEKEPVLEAKIPQEPLKTENKDNFSQYIEDNEPEKLLEGEIIISQAIEIVKSSQNKLIKPENLLNWSQKGLISVRKLNNGEFVVDKKSLEEFLQKYRIK